MPFDLLADFDPHPGQARIMRCPARFLTAVAGRRYGKDHVGARKMVDKLFTEDYPRIAHLPAPSPKFAKYEKPLLHYWCVAPDYNIGKIQQRELFSIFPKDFKENRLQFDYNDNTKELRLLSYRILIEFKSADRPDSLVAVGLDGVYITEFARIKETAWTLNIRPTLTDKQGWLIATTTPLPRKWFRDHVNLGLPTSDSYTPEYQTFFGKTIDNIRLKNIEQEVALARKTMPARWFRREYEASMECFEGQIYDEFNESVHCHPKGGFPNKFDYVLAGVDWGFAQPMCILIIGVIEDRQNRRTRFYAIDESYGAQVLMVSDGDCWVQRAKYFQDQYKVDAFICDSEDPEAIATFQSKGIRNVRGAIKTVHDGIQTVATAMHISEITGEPNLFIDPKRCPNLVREVQMYQWDKDEDPLKEDDHSCDALRYPVHTFMEYGVNLQYMLTDLQPIRT